MESQILEKEYDPNYEPTQEEIKEYAEFLGMDLEKDKDYFWIAREGLKAPLPPEWKPCQTDDGQIYYFNFTTAESIWDHPCDEYYRNKFQTEKEKKEKKPIVIENDSDRDEVPELMERKDSRASYLKRESDDDVAEELKVNAMEVPTPGLKDTSPAMTRDTSLAFSNSPMFFDRNVKQLNASFNSLESPKHSPNEQKTFAEQKPLEQKSVEIKKSVELKPVEQEFPSLKRNKEPGQLKQATKESYPLASIESLLQSAAHSKARVLQSDHKPKENLQKLLDKEMETYKSELNERKNSEAAHIEQDFQEYKKKLQSDTLQREKLEEERFLNVFNEKKKILQQQFDRKIKEMESDQHMEIRMLQETHQEKIQSIQKQIESSFEQKVSEIKKEFDDRFKKQKQDLEFQHQTMLQEHKQRLQMDFQREVDDFILSNKQENLKKIEEEFDLKQQQLIFDLKKKHQNEFQQLQENQKQQVSEMKEKLKLNFEQKKKDLEKEHQQLFISQQTQLETKQVELQRKIETIDKEAKEKIERIKSEHQKEQNLLQNRLETLKKHNLLVASDSDQANTLVLKRDKLETFMRENDELFKQQQERREHLEKEMSKIEKLEKEFQEKQKRVHLEKFDLEEKNKNLKMMRAEQDRILTDLGMPESNYSRSRATSRAVSPMAKLSVSRNARPLSQLSPIEINVINQEEPNYEANVLTQLPVSADEMFETPLDDPIDELLNESFLSKEIQKKFKTEEKSLSETKLRLSSQQQEIQQKNQELEKLREKWHSDLENLKNGFDQQSLYSTVPISTPNQMNEIPSIVNTMPVMNTTDSQIENDLNLILGKLKHQSLSSQISKPELPFSASLPQRLPVQSTLPVNITPTIPTSAFFTTSFSSSQPTANSLPRMPKTMQMKRWEEERQKSDAILKNHRIWLQQFRQKIGLERS